MSKVAIQGNASGTGVFTIASPATNTDRTLTLPDEAGTVLTSAGALSVNASAPAASATIDASGNLHVGKTATGIGTAGLSLRGDADVAQFTRDGGEPLELNRLSSDGDIVGFYKDGTIVGSIASRSGTALQINSQSGDGALARGGNELYYWGNNNFYPQTDNTRDLGSIGFRWDDIFATNGTIQTSDANEKQDIETLSEAEARVAIACKGLLRKFRWKDAVAEKGDEARIHFGIIAQDLQDAFAAEGLDAGRYAMFISSTWWETQTEVPAVEADEENGIEAKESYTRTDTYETAEEAPEGATERTRLGVRYPELLAFIIGAI